MSLDVFTQEQIKPSYRTRECVKCSTVFSSENCPACAKIINAEWCKANAEKLKQKRAAYYQANKEKMKAQMTAYSAQNADALKVYHAEWVKRNPGKTNALSAKRRASRLQATPEWADEFFMSEAYQLAALRSAATGFKWHVDHIVPLQSKLVCGLHCEFNMRVIPGRENITKSNKHWPNMP